jgi:hypothetical protein
VLKTGAVSVIQLTRHIKDRIKRLLEKRGYSKPNTEGNQHPNYEVD